MRTVNKRTATLLVVATLAVVPVGCGGPDDDEDHAGGSTNSTAPLEGPTLPTVATDSELTPPDTCEVVPAEVVSEAVGFTVEASDTLVIEGAGDAGVTFSAAECTYVGSEGTVSVELVATPDPDAYLDLVRRDAPTTGGQVLEPDLAGLPPETVVVERAGERTYVIGGAAVYSVTGAPDVAGPLAVFLLDHV